MRRAKTFKLDETKRKKRQLKRTKSTISSRKDKERKSKKDTDSLKPRTRRELPRTKSSPNSKNETRKLSVPSMNVAETLKGHEDQITAILITKTGQIVTGSDDAFVRIWELNSGKWKCVSTLKGHRERVKGLCLFKEKWIVSASFDKSIRIWSLKGKYMKALEGHDLQVLCVSAFQTDLNETLLISGSADRTLRLWNVKAGKCTKVLKGHTQAVECVCAERNMIVSGSSDKTIRIWDQRRCQSTLRGHTGWVTCVAMNKQNIFSGAQDNTVRVWSIKTKETLHVLKKHRFWVLDVAVCGNIFLTASVDNTVRVWNLDSMKSTSVMKCETAVNCCALNEEFIVTGGKDGLVKLFDRNASNKKKSSIFPGTSVNMEGDAENDPEVWEELLHLGVGMKEIAEYLHTDDLLAYTRKVDSKPLESLVDSHGFHLESCHSRVKSLINLGGDLWPCCGSKTGFIKFPTEVVFMKGDKFDGKPKVGLALYDNRWAGSTPQHQGGAVQIYIFDQKSLKKESWFDESKSIHANACHRAFGAFPSGPYLRGEFGFDKNELNFCYDNQALFPFALNKEQVEMPYPLQRHLRIFWDDHYMKGSLPNEDENLAVKHRDNDGEHWFSLRKQLLDADPVALVMHEQKSGPIHPDLYEIRRQQQLEINQLNEQMTELEESALEVKCKYKNLLESYKRDERANSRRSKSKKNVSSNTDELQSQIEQLQGQLKIYQYKNDQLEKHVELLVENFHSDETPVKKFIKGKLGDFECISLASLE